MAYKTLSPAIILDCDQRSQSGIIQPLGRNNIPIIAISSQKDCAAFHSKYVESKIISPKIDEDEEDYIEFLLNLRWKGVLFYSNDVSALVMSKNKKQLQESGFLLSIPDIEYLEKVFDKWECYKISDSLNIPMPKTKYVQNIDDVYNAWKDFKKPAILKGTRLAGGTYQKAYRKNEIPECWEKIYNTVNSKENVSRDSGIILQEYLDYKMSDNWSCETIFTKNSKPISFFTIKRIRCSLNPDGSYSSRLFAGQYEKCTDIQNKTEKLLSSMNWQGFAHVEYFYVPEKLTFFLTEVNPRLPGYSYYPCSTGFNMALYYYYDLNNLSFHLKRSFPKSVYFETLHYPGDLTQGIVHSIKGNLNVISFLYSYCILLKPGLSKIIDPIRCDDLPYTLVMLKGYANNIFKDILKYIKKKFKKYTYIICGLFKYIKNVC